MSVHAYVVIKRVNAHAQTVSGLEIELFGKEQDAMARAEQLALKYQGERFAWAEILGEAQVMPQMKTTRHKAT